MRILEQRFFRRPRVLNQLHRVGLVRATSQTTVEELAALGRFAVGARTALEIGTYQGVSAACIAKVMAADSALYCVDPWPEVDGRPNPCWLICERHLRRVGRLENVRILRGRSADVEHLLPDSLDFVFVDGDHSWGGIETDWQILCRRLVTGGIVCLHDAVVPPDETWRQPDSVRFYQNIVAKDTSFEKLAVVHTLAVLRKVHLPFGR